MTVFFITTPLKESYDSFLLVGAHQRKADRQQWVCEKK
jgi:hypothetical protein